MVSLKYFSARKKTAAAVVIFLLLSLVSLSTFAQEMLPQEKAYVGGKTRIHFISLSNTTDAILLESNGHFGMVDSGEDWDYPDGTEYEFRDGVTTDVGYEQQVIHYLEEMGVEELDFYIATHSHSDHIGSGDEILEHFPTKRLYIAEYSDEYLLASHNDPEDPYYNEEGWDNLWDNQYVYDSLIAAAKKTGTEIITDLDLEINASDRTFRMGDMTIEIMNYERERDEEGNIIPVYDENCHSLAVLVTAYGKNALLTSDIDPSVYEEGAVSDTVRLVSNLISRYETGEEGINETGNNIGKVVPDIYDVKEDPLSTNSVTDSKDQLSDRFEEGSTEGGTIDETAVNTGKTISLDLMKMAHHSMDYNNTTYFLTSLNPKTVVITGFESYFNDRMKACLPDSQVFATATDSASVTAEFTEDGIVTEYTKMETDWMKIDGVMYRFDENGRLASGYYEYMGSEYCFGSDGLPMTEDGWAPDSEGRWHYWYGKGYSAKSEWILESDGKKYYCDEDGLMTKGWKEIEGSWYYFKSNGEMAADEWIDGYYVDENGIWIEDCVPPKWEYKDGNWYYCYSDGSYVKNQWKIIDGEKYYFNELGQMARYWNFIEQYWYYMGSDGAVRYGWLSDSQKWYYLDADGRMMRDWLRDCGNWYYLNSSGVMVTGWTWVNSIWYYMNGNGAMMTGWLWENGSWYYLNGNGDMVTGWLWIEDAWYFFDSSGAMVTGWLWDGGSWYYLYDSGAMASSAWIGEYYVQENGAMAVNQKIGEYYVGPDGRKTN